jgi:hypothetical protein
MGCLAAKYQARDVAKNAQARPGGAERRRWKEIRQKENPP